MKLSQTEKTRLYRQYGPWAVVTGASSGIGRELAMQLADAGLNLMLTARRGDLLERLAETLVDEFHVETKIVAVDLSHSEGIQAIVRASENLEVGLLVAAAGFGTSGNFIGSELADELNMLQVNCGALLHLTHHFGHLFASRKKGGIVLMSSMVGFQGVPYAAHYAATKAYVQSLGEALSLELKSLGVDVLAAAPGPVSSGFAERANMYMTKTLTPADIGVPILKALGRKSTVLPGYLTQLLVGALRTVPRWGKIRIMSLVMGGMTQHQRAAEMA